MVETRGPIFFYLPVPGLEQRRRRDAFLGKRASHAHLHACSDVPAVQLRQEGRARAGCEAGGRGAQGEADRRRQERQDAHRASGWRQVLPGGRREEARVRAHQGEGGHERRGRKAALDDHAWHRAHPAFGPLPRQARRLPQAAREVGPAARDWCVSPELVPRTAAALVVDGAGIARGSTRVLWAAIIAASEPALRGVRCHAPIATPLTRIPSLLAPARARAQARSRRTACRSAASTRRT